MFANLGWTEILILGGVLLLLFGARKFPEIGRSLGESIRNFHRGITGKLDEDRPTFPAADQHSDKIIKG